MAYSLINYARQIYFDSAYGMNYEGMVQMFKALESSGLRGFLGCSSAIFKAALVEFFQNYSVRDGKVVSAVQGKAVEITEEVFAGTFELPMEGLTDMTDVPKDLAFDARSAFSISGYGDPCFKSSPRVCGANLYFVEGCTRPGFGESKEFPPLKILNAKTVGTYVAKNENIAVEEVVDEPVVKKATPKKRLAPAVGELVAKKKRTTVGRAAPAEKDLTMIPVVQEPISIVPAATPKSHRRRAPKRKLTLQKGSDDEIVDNIVHQVIADTTEIETGEPDVEEPVVTETTKTATVETESRIDVSSITNYDEEPVVGTEEEKEAEKEKEIEPVATEGMSLDKFTDSKGIEPLSKVLARTDKSTSNEESMPIDDLLAMIPADMMLPSVTAEDPTKIIFGLGIEIPGVNEGDWYKASLPQIATTDKAPLVEKDTIKGHPAREMFSLICVDIECLVQIREQVIEEIVSFFPSFGLRRLAVLRPLSDISAKEE
ncbi:hypothetical protein F511_27657 [Dorcoceras hygrometricum]|uniref:Splicing factor 3B subunit 1-like n=1 Tax=Dorcoceras hygrometricum TaxID=472368 RepID=A0A2Z7AFY0_9LAMI|nr:hypothetical protein F511_27657 [Dorcoceras hygrometricum]